MQIDIPDALAPFFEKLTKEDIRRTYAVGLFLMGHLTLPQAATLAHLEEQVLRRQLESHGISIVPPLDSGLTAEQPEN